MHLLTAPLSKTFRLSLVSSDYICEEIMPDLGETLNLFRNDYIEDNEPISVIRTFNEIAMQLFREFTFYRSPLTFKLVCGILVHGQIIEVYGEQRATFRALRLSDFRYHDSCNDYKTYDSAVKLLIAGICMESIDAELVLSPLKLTAKPSLYSLTSGNYFDEFREYQFLPHGNKFSDALI